MRPGGRGRLSTLACGAAGLALLAAGCSGGTGLGHPSDGSTLDASHVVRDGAQWDARSDDAQVATDARSDGSLGDAGDAATGPVCGDQTAEGSESCDGADLRGQDCASQGFAGGGVIACASDCTFDLSGCFGGCGNGAAEGAEQCDGDDIGGWNCWTAAAHTDGELGCASDCTFDISGCHTCGNGIFEGPEQCEGADLGGQTCQGLGFSRGELACASDCSFDTSLCTTCGDGVISAVEECEGANLGGATCESLGYLPGGVLSCTGECLFDRAACTPSVCMERSPTNPLGRKALQTYVHPSVDVQIAVEIGAAIQTAGPTGAGANEAAVTIDQIQATGGSAGLLLTRAPVTAGLQAEVLDLLGRLSSVTGVSSVEVRSPGSPVLSHDGYDSQVSVVATVQLAAAVDLSTARNRVVAALFGLPVTSFSFPASAGPSGTSFLVSFFVQWRHTGMVAVMGAVTRTSEYDAGGDVTFRVDDAAGGTGLAEASATRAVTCFRYDLDRLPMADIIWVLDETGSMSEQLQEIATESVAFFSTANAYSLQFRMGVVNVEPSNNGAFCTGTGVSGDTFLTPSDLTAFQECVQAPWGGGTQAQAYEFGITQGEAAISGHLPRGNAPDRIRPGATLVVIYVTDERAQELKDDCGATGGGVVPVDPACLQSVIGPTVALLEPDHPTRPGRAYAIVQPPPSGCQSFSEVGQGYTDIVNAVGGQILSICPTDLGPAMQSVLQDIIAAAAPTKLPHRPISASLAVAKLDRTLAPAVSQPLARSQTDGFDYRAASNGVVFLSQDFSQLPYEMVISYEHWLSAERCWNGADDDGDGLVDCADTADCAGAVCGPHGQVCQGTSCACSGSSPESSCDDGADNDCDGLVDCADPDCPSVATESACGDGADNDCDGLVDCADPDCDGVGFCESPEHSCGDGLDNDGDGLVDGADLVDCGGAIYQATFDTSPAASGWTLISDWEWGTPSGGGPPTCHSGSCIGTKMTGDYSNGLAWGTCTATSPAIDLSGASNPSMTFYAWVETEGATYDGGNLKISTNGVTFSVLSAVTPAYNLSSVGGQVAWGEDTGTFQSQWYPFQANLSAYVGQTIWLQFGFRSDGVVTYPGWYIDDIVVMP